ncbi:acid protease [Obba rivulosa]|uniref:Acid protease n=1 Tax=Obba rivulosa TaxID=1052685 RepID=A0A8E2DL39_9APHY|nr:acid protease [Obba rivulosa]
MWSVLVLALALLSVAATGAEGMPVAASSPRAISLTSRRVPRNGRYVPGLRKRALKPFNVPLTDFFLGTDLQWFGNISVGTPPQPIPVVFDTGSETLEFVSTQCGAPCGNQTAFDVSASSTYVAGNATVTLQFATGGGVDPVLSPEEYELTLLNGTDTLTIGGHTLPNQQIFTIINETEKFLTDPYSGIQGMSASLEGFFGALVEQGLPALFSFFITPKAVGNAELTIGGIDESKFQGPLTYAKLPRDAEGSWELASPKITVNGKTNHILTQEREVIFDSGTSNVLFDTNTTEAIYAMISPNIKPFAAEPGAYGIPCSEIEGLDATISVTFTSTSGQPFDLTIPSSELNVGPFTSNTSVCQTLVNAFDGLSLVGGSLFKHYYTVWDVGNQQMGFAPNGF